MVTKNTGFIVGLFAVAAAIVFAAWYPQYKEDQRSEHAAIAAQQAEVAAALVNQEEEDRQQLERERERERARQYEIDRRERLEKFQSGEFDEEIKKCDDLHPNDESQRRICKVVAATGGGAS